MEATSTLITAALDDAAFNAPTGATIYIDPVAGGLAWQLPYGDDIASGSIGCEADAYGPRWDEDGEYIGDEVGNYHTNLNEVIAALEEAGYTVAD